MWPDVHVALILHVISTCLEEDEPGQPDKLTSRYQKFRLTIRQALDASIVIHDRTVIDQCGVQPFWHIDEVFLKAWAIEKTLGPALNFNLARATDMGAEAQKNLAGATVSVAYEWVRAHQAPLSLLRLAAKHDWQNKEAIEAEITRRRTGVVDGIVARIDAALTETPQQRAARDAAMELAAHR